MSSGLSFDWMVSFSYWLLYLEGREIYFEGKFLKEMEARLSDRWLMKPGDLRIVYSLVMATFGRVID